MRLFVAIDLDSEARTAIAAEQARLRRGAEHGSAMRWVRPDQMHLTLVFLGEVSEPRVSAVVHALEQPLDRRAFEAIYGGLGVFPPRGAPRALWIGALKGGDDLRALHEDIAARVRSVDVPLDDRAFSPHLTLARWKTSRPSDRTRILALGRRTAVARSRVDHATLYHSRLSSDGSEYMALARANLSGALPRS
jgi:2'-5' RNA ligase